MKDVKAIVMYALFLLFLLVIVWHITAPNREKDWYLVCSSPDKDYLVKSETKPYTKDGFIYIDGEAFITAEPRSTCKPVKGDVVRQAISQKNVL